MTPQRKIIDPSKRGIPFAFRVGSRRIRGRFRLPSKGALVLASGLAAVAVEEGQAAGGISAGLTAGLTHGLTAAGVVVVDVVHIDE